MWKTERDLVRLLLLATMAVATLVSAVEESGQHLRKCDPAELIGNCGKNERCAEDPTSKKFVCICVINYFVEVTGGKCVQRPTTTVPPRQETTTEKLNGASGSSGSSVAVGLLVPTFLILAAILGFCAARRYGFLPCRRNLYGNVLVTREDDDDDPPIA